MPAPVADQWSRRTRALAAACGVVGVVVAGAIFWIDHQDDAEVRDSYRGSARSYCSRAPAAPPTVDTAYLRSQTFADCVEGRIDELVATDGTG